MRSGATPVRAVALAAIVLGAMGGCAPDGGSASRAYDACRLTADGRPLGDRARAGAQDACVRQFARAPSGPEARAIESAVTVTFDDDAQHSASDTLDNAIQAASNPGDVLHATLTNHAADVVIKRVKVDADFYDGPAEGDAGFKTRKKVMSLTWMFDTDLGSDQGDELTGAFAGGKAPSHFYVGHLTVSQVLPATAAAQKSRAKTAG